MNQDCNQRQLGGRGGEEEKWEKEGKEIKHHGIKTSPSFFCPFVSSVTPSLHPPSVFPPGSDAEYKQEE